MPRSSALLVLFVSMMILLIGLPAWAGPDSGPVVRVGLTGNLRADALYGVGSYDPWTEPASMFQAGGASRNVPMAAGLSLLVPGLGQAYNRSWIKSALFAGAEAALLVGYFSWRQRGRDGEAEFQAYAHEFWSPIRYAQWLSGYTGYGGDPIALPSLTDEQFQQPEAWTSEQEQDVRDFFTRIRTAENQSIHIETGAAFSHVLPYFAEQQYYELIGKYFQYAPGWADYQGANDPEESGPDGRKVNVPDQFYDYAEVHADANDWFRRASRLSAILIVNHFLATIDAAVSAKLHNNRLQTRLSVLPTQDGSVQAMAGIHFTF